MDKARALWFEGRHRAVLQEEMLPELKPGWCKLESLFSNISPGTESLILSGQVPEEVYQEMKCPYMGGQFPFPVKYGYSLVGRITDGPKALLGKIAHLLHPHQDKCMVRIDDIFLVPPAVPAQRATLASNLETAVNAIWDAQFSVGDHALVVGFGAIGALVARLLSFFPGCRVKVMDTNPDKRRMAEKMGFKVLYPGKETEKFDLAFHASGNPSGLQSAVNLVGFEGKVVEMSWYGKHKVSLSLGGNFHSQRKSIISSQVSYLSPGQRSRWNHRRRKSLVFDLLQRLEFDEHLTYSVAFSKLPEIYSKLKILSRENLGYLVSYQERNNHV
jgi:2-desacetyl-2-hydroxyethyl bacteriochlorophyllide A dehydrogenase